MTSPDSGEEKIVGGAPEDFSSSDWRASQPIDLERILAVLRRHIGLILLCVVVVAGAALGFSALQPDQYSASASLLFRNPGFAEDLFGTTSTAANPVPAREAATNEKLVGLQVVAERTATRLKSVSAEEVADMVKVESEGEAELVSVTATSHNPREAQLVANVFARQFIAFRAEADKSRLLNAKRLAEREFERLPPAQKAGVRGESLSRAAEKLSVLASLQTGNAELVQPADLPTSPSSPKPLRNGVLGAILGLLLGIGLAFLFERLNRRLRDPEETQKAFALPVIGTIPESRAIMASNQGGVAPELPFLENESFRMLRASLRYFSVDREVRSVLITSYAAEVGKSTVAWNLARVAATSVNAIIVETDLRNPTLARQHGLKIGPGLADLLTHQVTLDEVIQSKPVAVGSNGTADASRSLDVIVSGSLPPNPAELIESKAMRETLAHLSGRYDLIVVDTAPVGVVADAFPLLREVDGVIAVARMEKTTRDSAEHMREQLGRLEAPLLGVVANAVKRNRGRKKYGYGYYGGYYGGQQKSASTPADEPSASVAQPNNNP
ncbi:MAG TPA: polysaccharide biosynthesis tyrosine autokinase [Solirubrobacterales bacterium]|nr:polysaccharide biosynthesis tyrosine autokinase [Solirubrobacterales bacterium]